MTLRLKFANSRHATFISAYAPTLDATDETKEGFYTALDCILASVSANDKVFLLGDVNARVGKKADLCDCVPGRHGVENINDYRVLLLSKCAEYELVIMNATGRMKDEFKTSWMHPKSKHWHLIDYVVTRQRDRADVLITIVMRCSTACWTEHRLIPVEPAIQIAPQHRKQHATKSRLDVGKLTDTDVSHQLQQNLEEKLADVQKRIFR